MKAQSGLFGLIWTLASVAVGFGQGTSGTDPSGGREAAPQLATGKAVYEKHCAACHGAQGNGEGPAAYLLFPKPRDFTKGVYKFTSTAAGDPPLDADLVRTVTQGMPGTSMPSFGAILSDSEIAAVIQYIRQFEPAHPEPEVVVPEAPNGMEPDIENGEQVYTQLGCAQCHGQDGMANTPVAQNLVDTWGEPLVPAALPYGIFKGGGSREEIFRTIIAGIKGTPMPGFGGLLGQSNFTKRAFWDLSGYVLSMSEEDKQEPLSDESAEVTVHRKDFMTADPWNVHWDEVEPVVLGLHPLWQRSVPPPPIKVRAVHNGEALSLLLEWRDSTKDWAYGNQEFAPDAVAVQYPVRGERAPFIGMGDNNLKSLLRIWHWQAHRQQRVTNHDYRDVERAHPNMAVDWYPEEKGRRRGERPSFKGNQDGLTEQPPLYLPAMAAGNPSVRPESLEQTALEYLSQGFGSLTSLPPEKNHLEAKGVWLQGKWRVVIQRPLVSGDVEDRDFVPGKDAWMALALWDGFHGDRNGKKSVTRWARFIFEQ